MPYEEFANPLLENSEKIALVRKIVNFLIFAHHLPCSPQLLHKGVQVDKIQASGSLQLVQNVFHRSNQLTGMIIEKLQLNTINSILTSESPGNSISMKSRLLTSVPSGAVIVNQYQY